MMVANHFDVRWVDGYSAVSDVPSSLAATIEKLAAELPSSHDRIELAIRDVRKPDGSTVWVGLLRFVVAVSSAPRPLGFLHAAVLPAGYAIDLDGWRALVARRYGEQPEDRIRTLYEELAEATKDIGRDRLHALSIRPEDVRELLQPAQESEPSPSLPRAHARPGSRPPKGYPRPPSTPGVMPAPAPPSRASQSMLPLSMRIVELPESAAERPDAPEAEELPEEQDLPNDITQPMDVPPSGAAPPFSGELARHPPTAERAKRAWWMLGAAVGALALLLGAMGWLAHRNSVLVAERNRLRIELLSWYADRQACERDRAEIEQCKRELTERRTADKTCTAQIKYATEECKESLTDARSLARAHGDKVTTLLEEARLRATELQEAKHNLAKIKNDLNAAAVSKDRAEQLYREEQSQNKQLRTSLTQQHEQLRVLCRRLQSAPGGKPPKDCQGIK
jgi:hypothetical protein